MIINSYRYAGGAPAAWTPANLASLVAWYDASDLSTITESGGAVSQWDDKSGNANHLTQSTGIRQPETGLNTINSLNVLNFVQDAMAISSDISSNTFTWAIVHNANEANDRLIDMRGTGASGIVKGVVLKSQKDISLLIDEGNGNYKVYGHTTTLSGTNVHLVTVGLSAATDKVYLNGTDETIQYGTGGSYPTDVANSTPKLTVGGNYEQITQFLNDDDIGEIVITNAVLSTSDRQKLEGYLAHKWGTTANLPAAHPYKTVAP